MSRGITENDVWQAADALLLEGARPTIERVRQKIGRGSPNTVSPHLDTWFKHLGGRIKDPGAFAAPPEVPDPVLQVARHLWEVAQADARKDLDQRLQIAMAAAVANVEAEKERAAIAEAATFEAAARATRLQGDLEELSTALEQERIGQATARVQAEEAGRQVASLLSRVADLSRELAESRADQQRQLDLVLERATAVERRAALEIDAARQGQARAERRADALDRKLEAMNAELRASTGKVAELGALLKLSADQHIAAVKLMKSELARERNEAVKLNGLLVAERSSLKAAEAEAAMAKALFEKLPAFEASATAPASARASLKRPRG